LKPAVGLSYNAGAGSKYRHNKQIQ